jgi:hypothetical protein
MKGLGMWTRTLDEIQRARPKALKKMSPEGKSLLSEREPTSGSEESAAVRFVKLGLISFGDEFSESDNDPAVVRTVETLSVVGNDAPISTQEKETRSSGGIPPR